MAQPASDFRPQVESVECLGARVELRDPAAVLRSADAVPVPLLQGSFPAPVRDVSVSVTTGLRDGVRVHRFRGEVRIAREGRAERSVRDQLAAVAPAAAVVLAGIGGPLAAALAAVAASEAGRQRDLQPAPPRPPGGHGHGADDTPRPPAARPTSLQDPTTGLVATVDYEPAEADAPPGEAAVTGATVAATVPSAGVEPAHLRAFCCLVLRAAAACADRPDDETFLAGRSLLVGRRPEGQRVRDDDSDVRLEQVGGLDEVVRQLREVAVSFNHPRAMAKWGAKRPQGILMYGPPGTGKTMLARALAAEIGATLREIRTPEILDKYLGGSERNIKNIFAEARRYRRPTVVLFDEFDSIISYTGDPSDAAGQAVNSVAGIFKQEMNTLVQENPNVIVVATTNFPDRVDESLVRSGRFDIKVSVPLPDAVARADILGKVLRQLVTRHETAGFRMFADDLDVPRLAHLSVGMTGADLKEVLRRVRLAKALEEALGGSDPGPITQHDLERSIADMRR